MTIMQGDSYPLELTITSDGESLTDEGTQVVEIALGALVKTWPGEVSFSGGVWLFPLSQQETFAMPAGEKTLCVRVKRGGVWGAQTEAAVTVTACHSRAVL